MSGKIKTVYECTQCQYHSPAYLGRCPECEAWGTLSEVQDKRAEAQGVHPFGRRGEAPRLQPVSVTRTWKSLHEVTVDHAARLTTGLGEFDRVLGGGILPGSYLLIGGDPGIGKSTLMLQVADTIARQPGDNPAPVCYVAGEESPHQIKQRADRLGIDGRGIEVVPENNIHRVIDVLNALKPRLAIIDSIQSLYDPELSGTPGSVGQMKQCAGLLMGVAKANHTEHPTSIALVGHVTKEGSVSGPKLLEHTVDAVMYFEGDRYRNLRVLRTVKNRFGNTQEIGLFEMGAGGLREVTNPSALFLSQPGMAAQPGSVVIATMEGTRPILVELQALVGQSTYASPRRVANGVESTRLNQIVAVLERRLGVSFAQQDIYINVVGGLTVDEPAADLGIAMAILSSLFNVPVKPHTVLIGEVGLTGEIRSVRQLENRLAEAGRIGFSTAVAPEETTLPENAGCRLLAVDTLLSAIRQSLDGAIHLEDDGGRDKPPRAAAQAL
ncbi:MAG: DNA repair protein RadA [Candidatus Melainabacteria bacterium]